MKKMISSQASEISTRKKLSTALIRKALSLAEPPPRLTVSQWANKHRMLSPEGSSRPGKYLTSYAPYQIEPMDSANASDVQSVCLMFASQLGKTEILNNVVAYFIDADPAPILVVQPTVEFAEAWSKERLMPMIRDTERLSKKVSDSKSRDSGNTILHKSFPGGNIAIVGSNAPSGLAGRPRRVVALDEVDRYPPSSGTEGDPCALAIRRTESFWNCVIYLTSTPTIRNVSRIEKEFELTDKRHWMVPCHACGKEQSLKWCQVKWPKDNPKDAYYECEHCKSEWTDTQRLNAVKSGRWVATAPFTGKRGYFINGINSPFRHKKGFKSRLHQMVSDFLEAKSGGKDSLKTWTNTFLAETWSDEAERIDHSELEKRRENYLPELPDNALVVTAGVDVQKDRVCVNIDGWGRGEESWGLLYREIPGDVFKPQVWADLLNLLTQSKWKKKDGTEFSTTATCVDSSAYTDDVYAFCRPLFGQRIWAIKGSSSVGKPIAGTATRGNRRKCPVYSIGVDTAKTTLFGRMKIAEPGPGFMHFPVDEVYGYDHNFFQMLTAEEPRTKRVKGFVVREWHKTRPRNEALDCKVYSMAALAILQPDWAGLITTLAKKNPRAINTPEIEAKPEPVIEPKKQQNPLLRRPGSNRGSWINGWRSFG